MGTLTKREIVLNISNETGLVQHQVFDVVQKTLDQIVEALARGDNIELRNFGVFEVKRRKARKARNPRTGDKVDVAPKNVVTFKPGKEMEERVRQLDIDLETVADTVLSDGNGKEDHARPTAGPRPNRSRRSS